MFAFMCFITTGTLLVQSGCVVFVCQHEKVSMHFLKSRFYTRISSKKKSFAYSCNISLLLLECDIYLSETRKKRHQEKIWNRERAVTTKQSIKKSMSCEFPQFLISLTFFIELWNPSHWDAQWSSTFHALIAPYGLIWTVESSLVHKGFSSLLCQQILQQTVSILGHRWAALIQSVLWMYIQCRLCMHQTFVSFLADSAFILDTHIFTYKSNDNIF